MVSLIVIFLFALGVSYFAIQNTTAVPIIFANSIFQNVPLYFIVIASVLVGLILASLISSIDTLSAYMKLRGKDNRIHNDEKVIDDLQQKVHDLEIENAKLKGGFDQTEVRDAHPEIARKDDSHRHFRPTFMGGLLHPHAKA